MIDFIAGMIGGFGLGCMFMAGIAILVEKGYL